MRVQARYAGALALAATTASLALLGARGAHADGEKIKVKVSLGVFGAIAREVGGDAIDVEVLTRPTDDPHDVTATPQLIESLKKADIFVVNGIGLETWAEKSVDESKNEKIKKGQPGYCCITDGLAILDVPAAGTVVTNEEHAYGNPHMYMEPLVGHTYAKNLEAALGRISPDKVDAWERNREIFDKKLYEAVFGAELVEVMGGGERLEKLCRQGKLDDFLKKNKFKDKPLSDLLGGLLKKAAPLKGMKFISYHDSVNYFSRTYGCDFLMTLEPKSGVAPPPKHLEEVARVAQKENVKVVFVTTCEPVKVAQDFAARIGAKVAVVPSDVGAEDTKDFIGFETLIVDRALAAVQ
jgi:zinc/manganese transport system substrate-binding protein